MRCRNLLKMLVCVACVAIVTSGATAAVRLPAIIGDNMVLQRDQAVPFWGWADKGEEVTVSVAGQTLSTKADDNGHWKVELDKLQIGKPLEMTIKGSSGNSITVKNILVGEVWLCSGQSNMQWTVGQSNDAAKEVAAADYPQIRLITVPSQGTQDPQNDFHGSWAECSPQTVGNFSAVGYFFGRKLQQDLNVPIGLIHCSWGGSSCEAWIKRSSLEADPKYQAMLKGYDKSLHNYPKKRAEWQKEYDRVQQLIAEAKAAGKEPPAPLGPLGDPRVDQYSPANCYNGMLLPVMPYAIRGAIWYQGETNAGRAYQYRDMFPLLIREWRREWAQGDFPFYFVQLANWQQVSSPDGTWAELREAQTMALSTPNTGMAVTIDIGDATSIHPTNKQDVGKRLALWALTKTYGKDLVYSGPLYRSMEKKGNQIVISFDHIGGGLAAKDGKPLTGFAIAGADKKFVSADAKIEGETVVVESPKVPEPVAVRYAWAINPVCNLYNQAGLPASPFRTDTWKGMTEGK